MTTMAMDAIAANEEKAAADQHKKSAAGFLAEESAVDVFHVPQVCTFH
jgi:hypothetical protein